MALKLIIHIIIVALVVCFFGFNFETKVDIKFWFNDSLTLKDISLFVSLGAAYLLGVVSFLPSYISKSLKVKKKKKSDKSLKKIEPEVIKEDVIENEDE